MEFKEIAQSRYATKKFTGEVLPEEKITELKELIQLSASSFGLQPYVIKVVSDKDVQSKLQEAAFGQEQLGTASHVFVFCAFSDVKSRIDTYEEMIGADTAPEYIGMMRSAMESRTREEVVQWAAKQTYIALGNGLNGAKSLGFDSCPMEGFDPAKFSEILGLSDELVPLMIMPVGVAADEPREKVRYPLTTLFA